MLALTPYVRPIVLLVASNVFMTAALVLASSL
jgi:uncharacterized protein (DUF486 family)